MVWLFIHVLDTCFWGRFKNTCELLNFHLSMKFTSFNVWVRYFVWNFKGTLWNFTQNILPIHWKILFLYNFEILRALRFKSSYAFLKRPPGTLITIRYSTFTYVGQSYSHFIYQSQNRHCTYWRATVLIMWLDRLFIHVVFSCSCYCL